MTTPFSKPVSREFQLKDIYDHHGDVIITMMSYGLEFRKKGTSRKIKITWEEIGSKAKIPPNAPSKYVGNPLGWLVE